MELECITGLMEGDMKASGKIIIWKAMEYTPGKMEGAIKGNIRKIKSMDMGYTRGLTGGDMKDGGVGLSNLA